MKQIPFNRQTAKCRPFYTMICLGAILTASVNFSSGATVSIGVDHWGIFDPEMPAPSNADLVNAGSAHLLYFNSTSFSTPLGIFDGGIGASLIQEDADEYPATITFTLDTIENPLGYEISSVRTQTLAGGVNLDFSDGRMQYYKLEYSVVGNTDFETLLTVDVRDFEPEGPDFGEGWTWVTLLDIEDELTGVDALKFTWMDPSAAYSNSGSWIGEIDIVGAPVMQVPEPGAAILLLGAASLLWRRVKSH